MAVTFQAVGTAVSATTGTLTVAWPAHVANDIALLWVTSSAGGTTQTLSTANGFTLIDTQTTGTGTAGTKLSVYWARATSSAMAAPVVAAGTDFKYGVITTYRGVVTSGTPINAFAGAVKATASTTANLPAVTTIDYPNCMVVLGVSSDVDSAAAFLSLALNSNLTSITERFDAGTVSGLGGGIAVSDGILAAPGATGTTSATLTSSINAMITVALTPAVTALSLPFLDDFSTNTSAQYRGNGLISYNSTNLALNVFGGTTGAFSAFRTFSGFTIGQSYTVSGNFKAFSPNVSGDATVGVTGIGSGVSASYTTAYASASYTFTATSTVHELSWTGITTTASNTNFLVDDAAIVTAAAPTTKTGSGTATFALTGSRTATRQSAAVTNLLSEPFENATVAASFLTAVGTSRFFDTTELALDFYRADSVAVQAYRDLSGFTVGGTYIVSGKFKNFEPAATGVASVGIQGVGSGAAVPISGAGYTTASYKFVATSTTHRLLFDADSDGANASDVFLDDVTVLPAFKLAASGVPVKRVDGSRTAALKLAASASSANVRNGSATATLKLAATRTAAGVHAGTSTGTIKLAASSVGAKVAPGTRTATIRLFASGTPAPTRTGTRTATIRLTAVGISGDKVGAASATIRLLATTAQNSVRTGAATATLKLAATRTAAPVRAGTRTATLKLASTGTGVRTHAATGTATLHLGMTVTTSLQKTSTATGTMWLASSYTAGSIRTNVAAAVLLLLASGVGVKFLTLTNITVTAHLLPRRWDAELTPRNKTGALLERDNTGTLLERTNTGTLTERRWEGHTTK